MVYFEMPININNVVVFNNILISNILQDGDWCLMCPDQSPGLHEVWGEEFETLYEKYEKEGRYEKKLKAQTLWYAIIESQIETGTPYMLYKDACNRKSNQQNLGTIKCSNLCTEICLPQDVDNVSVCNLASINLSQHVVDGAMDWAKIEESARIAVRQLDNLIDITRSSVAEADYSNEQNRAVGLGVMGFTGCY